MMRRPASTFYVASLFIYYVLLVDIHLNLYFLWVKMFWNTLFVAPFIVLIKLVVLL